MMIPIKISAVVWLSVTWKSTTNVSEICCDLAPPAQKSTRWKCAKTASRVFSSKVNATRDAFLVYWSLLTDGHGSCFNSIHYKFLAKNNITVLDHPPHSHTKMPDLSLKSVIENSTNQLKVSLVKTIQSVLKSWNKRCQKCMASKVDHSERDTFDESLFFIFNKVNHLLWNFLDTPRVLKNHCNGSQLSWPDILEICKSQIVECGCGEIVKLQTVSP